MYAYFKDPLPVVFVGNTAESFFDYVSRASNPLEQQHLIREMQGLSDRALLLPIAKKLAIISHPLDHLTLLQEYYGYSETEYLYPKNPSPYLSLDILESAEILAEIERYAGINRTLYLIPHATTAQFMQLVEHLQHHLRLTVLLPESPSSECLWLRDYIDSKSGFHRLAASWLRDTNCQLPLSIPCRTRSHAASVVQWFGSRNLACIVKADQGNDALGHTIFEPNDTRIFSEIMHILQQNEFLEKDVILVEEFITVADQLFPSIELFVPPLTQGDPYVTYLCNQCFSEVGRFLGLLIDRTLSEQFWYAPLKNTALEIATRLQEMGYVGHFDIDAMVDRANNIYLLEINARRTGGTHVHEVATFLLGSRYLETFTLLSNTGVDAGQAKTMEDLQRYLSDLLFPRSDGIGGVVITHTSTLDMGKFGCILIATSLAEVKSLQLEMVNRLAL